jgi:formylglycine-generating enzyme required for sulfatase activity
VLEKPQGSLASQQMRSEEHGTFDQDKAMDMVAQLCSILSQIYSAGRSYGRLCSDNLVVNADYQVTLLNVPVLSSLESYSVLEDEKKVFYIAPEIWNGQECSPASEIYALGCLLHEFFEGRPPFLGEEQRQPHMEEECPGLNGIPSRSEKTMLKCLEKQPKNRFKGFSELKDPLMKSSGGPKGGGSSTRIVLIAAVLVVGLGGGGWFAWDYFVTKPKIAARKKAKALAEKLEAEKQKAEQERKRQEMLARQKAADEEQKAKEKKKELAGKPVKGMIFFKGGSFSMGSYSGEADSKNHDVALSPFYFDMDEVTNEEYRVYIEETGAEPPSNSIPKFNLWQGREIPQAISRQPVMNVDWYMASEYCKSKDLRLPTEAEWEFVARGKEGRTYPWGNTAPSKGKAQYDTLDWNGEKTLYEVDFFKSGVTPQGVYNMFGGVKEWVSDWYSAEYYSNSPEKDPAGPDSGDKKVVRGASWEDPADLFSYIRDYYHPNIRTNTIGFRCARSWTPEDQPE